MFRQIWESLPYLISQFRFQDVLDVGLVWLIVYRVLILIRRSGTIQVLLGFGVLAVGYLTSIWLELYTFNWLLEKFFSNLFVIAVVLFQGEIRRALAHIGSRPFFSESTIIRKDLVEEIAAALEQISTRGLGALIVFEREILIDHIIEKGTEVRAQISRELLLSIFLPQSPLHDGAVLVRDGKIFSAACFLPLSKNPSLDKNWGSRHRAALGITEETDAQVYLVSEENQKIVKVESGSLSAPLFGQDLRDELEKTLLGRKKKSQT